MLCHSIRRSIVRRSIKSDSLKCIKRTCRVKDVGKLLFSPRLNTSNDPEEKDVFEDLCNEDQGLLMTEFS